MNLLIGALTIGFILSLLAMGVLISFRFFRFPDITTDGSITVGACIAAFFMVCSSQLIVGDIGDWQGLCEKMRREAGQDTPSPSKRICALLSPEPLSAIEARARGTALENERKAAIVKALNDVLQRRDFYTQTAFRSVALPDEALALLGSWEFRVSDVLDWPGLCARLVDESGKQTPSPGRRAWQFLSGEIREALRQTARGADLSAGRKADIVEQLNDMVEARAFYHEEDFANVELSEEATGLLKAPRSALSERHVQRLNRLLLESAYPSVLTKASDLRALSDAKVRRLNRLLLVAAYPQQISAGLLPTRCGWVCAVLALVAAAALLMDKGCHPIVATCVGLACAAAARHGIAVLLTVHAGNPLCATFCAFVGGAIAGAVTGILHAKFRIHGLLSGILVMTALYSINLWIMGRSNLPLMSATTLVTWAEASAKCVFAGAAELNVFGWDVAARDAATLVGSALTIAIAGGLVYLFFRTDLGTAMRATGDNDQMIRALGVNTDNMLIMGLALANGLTALSGALLAQYQGFADVQMGIGMVVWGLASVILGQALVAGGKLGLMIAGTVMGSVLFRLLVAIVLRAGLNPNNLKLVTAVFVFLALVLPGLFAKIKERLRESHA